MGAVAVVGVSGVFTDGVGQSDALEFVFKLELPNVVRQIRRMYATFIHLSAVED